MSPVHVYESPLPLEVQRDVLELDRRTSLSMGRESLVEQARFAVSSPSGPMHFVDLDDQGVHAYAQGVERGGHLELEFIGAEPSPALLESAIAAGSARDLDIAVWLHGVTATQPSPLGVRAVLDREILRLHRPLPLSESAPVPEGFHLRAFEPARDVDTWLALNARSFASHPEQGGWTNADLEHRVAAAWFDPSGFLILENATGMAGFCWTKIHDLAWDTIGEIYVIGVDPGSAGHGLGRMITVAGLASLFERGCPTAMLYVESDNRAARALYDSLGFSLEWVDQRWISVP